MFVQNKMTNVMCPFVLECNQLITHRESQITKKQLNWLVI